MTFKEWLKEIHNLDIDIIDDLERAEYYEKYTNCGYGLDI